MNPGGISCKAIQLCDFFYRYYFPIISIALRMVFKVCTKNPARKAAQAEWVMWTPRILAWVSESLAYF